MDVIVTSSRFNTEFELINFIGKGEYGDVLKVKNNLDLQSKGLDEESFKNIHTSLTLISTLKKIH